MQLRKVQEMGGATLVVSLPKDWARSLSIVKGTILSIENSADGGLLVYPVRGSETEHPEKAVTIDYPSRYAGESGLTNQITAAYLLGYDMIHVKGKHRISPKDRQQIVRSIQNLIGMEVVEEDGFAITSQFLVDNAAVEPSKIFKRISALVRSMVTDIMNQFLSEEKLQLETMAQRDDEVDRLHFLLVRLIRKAVIEPRSAGKFGLSSIDCLDYRVAASSLETAGDYAVELATSASKLEGLDGKMKKEIDRAAQVLDSIQEQAARSFISRDFTIAREVRLNYEKLELVLKTLEKQGSQSDDVGSILHVLEILERISRCQRDIADLVSPLGVV